MSTSARSWASSLPSSGSCLPSMVIVPDSMVSRWLIARHRVDLPDPDGPMTTTTSPAPTVRSMSLSTCRSPKCLLTPVRTTRASVMQVNLATVGTARPSRCAQDGQVAESRPSGDPELPYPFGDGPHGAFARPEPYGHAGDEVQAL